MTRQMFYKPSGLLQLHKVVEDYMVLTFSPLGLWMKYILVLVILRFSCCLFLHLASIQNHMKQAAGLEDNLSCL